MDYDDDAVYVCMEHMRFAPCRRCMVNDELMIVSCDPEDVAKVREYQNG